MAHIPSPQPAARHHCRTHARRKPASPHLKHMLGRRGAVDIQAKPGTRRNENAIVQCAGCGVSSRERESDCTMRVGANGGGSASSSWRARSSLLCFKLRHAPTTTLQAPTYPHPPLAKTQRTHAARPESVPPRSARAPHHGECAHTHTTITAALSPSRYTSGPSPRITIATSDGW